jgi:hypothetical protein
MNMGTVQRGSSPAYQHYNEFTELANCIFKRNMELCSGEERYMIVRFQHVEDSLEQMTNMRGLTFFT